MRSSTIVSKADVVFFPFLNVCVCDIQIVTSDFDFWFCLLIEMTTGELAWGNCLPGKLPPRENSAGVRLFTDLVDFYRSGGANGSKRSFLWL